MSAVKERILGAVSMMDETKAHRLWRIIEQDFSDSAWDNIPECDPDETDLHMLREMEQDPDCREFVPASEARRALGLQ